MKQPSISYENDIQQEFQERVSALGMTDRTVWCDNIFNSESCAVASEVLGSGDKPDVVIASTDSLALAVLWAASGTGIAVPEALEVVGEGAMVLAASASPPLTTVSRNFIGAQPI